MFSLRTSFTPLFYQAYQAIRKERDNDYQDNAEKEHIIIRKLSYQYFFQVGKKGSAEEVRPGTLGDKEIRYD